MASLNTRTRWAISKNFEEAKCNSPAPALALDIQNTTGISKRYVIIPQIFLMSHVTNRYIQDTHFLQIWAKPNKRGLTPSYNTRKFTDEMKTDKLVRIIESVDRHSGGDAENDPIPAHVDLSMSASILSPGKSVTHELVADGERKVFVQLVMTGKTQPKSGGAKIKIGDVELGEGDGAFVEGAKGPGSVTIESVGEKPAEFLLFDMGLDDA
jgi:hypothetical protein